MNKPVRILHMIGCLEMGGSQSMIMNIYRNINHDVIQFDFVIDNEIESPYVNEIKNLGGRIYVMPKFNGKNIFRIRKEWDSFFKNHKEYRVIHSHVRSYASIYLPIAKRNGLKTIIHSHSTSNGNGISSLVKSLLQYPLRYQADYFFACSNYAGKWLFGDKVISSKRYKTIKNAIDTEIFTFNEDVRKRMRSQLKIEDEYVIGHVGRFTQAKNHSFLLSCFAECQKEDPKLKLILVGDGELRDRIKKEVLRLALEKDVIFVGAKDNVCDYYQAMDCFVFPSLWEGFGISVIEAQAADLPIICSDNVPQGTRITDIIEYLPLDSPIDDWCKAILSFKDRMRGKERKQEIRRAGYDIKETSKWFESFYLKISKR